jgi:hypothetical protein
VKGAQRSNGPEAERLLPEHSDVVPTLTIAADLTLSCQTWCFGQRMFAEYVRQAVVVGL